MGRYSNIQIAYYTGTGGGEVSPNTACRISSIKRLKAKGYQVVYETMMIMPSNFMVATKKPLDVMLLQILPSKVDLIVHEILSGVHKKSTTKMIDKIFSIVGELEKPMARLWGRLIKVLAHCNGCGRCAQNCPSHNIVMISGKPKFANR